jgi:hypothetical protein
MSGRARDVTSEGTPSRRRSPATIALAAAVLVAAIVLLAGLLHEKPRRIGSNNRGTAAAAQLAPHGGRLCQAKEPAPPKTGTLGLFADGIGRKGGQLEVSVLDRVGGQLARGKVAREGVDTGSLVVRLDKALPGGEITLCIVNRGPVEVRVYGDPASEADAARVTGMPQYQQARLRVDWLTADDHSAFGWSSTVARRFPLVKASFFGTWTMWAALGLLLLSCAFAVWTVARAVRE